MKSKILFFCVSLCLLAFSACGRSQLAQQHDLSKPDQAQQWAKLNKASASPRPTPNNDPSFWEKWQQPYELRIGGKKNSSERNKAIDKEWDDNLDLLDFHGFDPNERYRSKEDYDELRGSYDQLEEYGYFGIVQAFCGLIDLAKMSHDEESLALFRTHLADFYMFTQPYVDGMFVIARPDWSAVLYEQAGQTSNAQAAKLAAGDNFLGVYFYGYNDSRAGNSRSPFNGYDLTAAKEWYKAAGLNRDQTKSRIRQRTLAAIDNCRHYTVGEEGERCSDLDEFAEEIGY